ncbi:MAG: heavy metal-binding domain-containing protein [Ktedonobacteraceae bacterium]|nr:heavy metal-binding domain-containing protein [Ktedonobacteraceae bacterium]
MPFWQRSSPEEKERRLQQQQADEISRQSLEAGGLPTRASQRLAEEQAAGHPLFTSDLSTNEFLLTREQGYQPLSQVMGSSIYQVGWQYTRRYTWDTSAQELGNLSQAHQQAAILALGRLEQEAKLLRAHGVIGVRFSSRGYDWGSNLIEYTAIGTAIRLPDTPLGARPFLSDLSGQEFWTLLQAGYYPAGVVFGYCSYYVSLGSRLTQQINSWWNGGGYNQEIVPFSQGIYTARHLAMTRVSTMAQQHKALGIVGMHIDNQRQVMEYETEQPPAKYLDLFVHFSAVGTAITSVKKDHVIPTPKPTLTLTDLRPGRYGQQRELTFRG